MNTFSEHTRLSVHVGATTRWQLSVTPRRALPRRFALEAEYTLYDALLELLQPCAVKESEETFDEAP